LFDQHSKIVNAAKTHTFKTGLDYFLNKKQYAGHNGRWLSFGLYYQDPKQHPISYIPDAAIVKVLEANNSNDGKKNNGNLNLNYRHTDSSGHDLNMDADYGIYRLRSNQLQPNLYFDPSGGYLLYSDVFNMLAPTDIDLYSFKTDYEQNFKKGRLGLGFKTTYTTSDNDFQQYNVYPNAKVKDTLHSNGFNYKENINAVYANYNRNLKGFMIQAGLRVENTNAKGISTGYKESASGYATYDSSFNRHYTGFFPSGAITYNKDPMKQWTIAYSRRIDRPPTRTSIHLSSSWTSIPIRKAIRV